MVFGSGLKGAACAVAEVAASSNPASPIASAVLGMPRALRGFRIRITMARISCQPETRTAERTCRETLADRGA
jgi:hypothetical protein